MSGRRRLRLAQLLRALPQFPGRDASLAALTRPVLSLDAPLLGTFGGGLRFEGNLAADANLLPMLLLRHVRPPLAPVLDACLEPGDVFADAGANLGIYALWAARRVGPAGRVHAFEPVAGPRNRLSRNAALNSFENVEVEAAALGATPGRVILYQQEGSSAHTSRYAADRSGPLEVPATTLDAYFAARRPPDLVKLHVEGMELQVLRGARELLRGERAPAVVFEARPAELAAAGTCYAELLGALAEAGYRAFALGGRGLAPEPPGAREPGSRDVLGLRPDRPAHERARLALARHRFEPEGDF